MTSLAFMSKAEARRAIARSLEDNLNRIIAGHRYRRYPPDDRQGGYWGKTQYSVKKYHKGTGNCPRMRRGWLFD